jgi:hypothetical protein
MLNGLYHAFEISHDVVVPKPQHAVTVTLEVFCSVLVPDHISIGGTGVSINLENKSRLMASKIREVRSDRRLPAKMRTDILDIAQSSPQFSLGCCHFAS